MIRCLLSAYILFATSPSWAIGDLLFGPEFTFSNEDIRNNQMPASLPNPEDFKDAGEAYWTKLMARMCGHLIDGQKDPAKFLWSAHCTFSSPNSWDFSVIEDNDVIEVKMAPMTVEKYKQFKNDIQDAIFVSAANEDLFPYDYLGGGHINIGLEALVENPLLLRNFIVDFFNHAELALGVLNYDTNNALPLALLPKSRWSKIQKILDTFDSGHRHYWGDAYMGPHQLLHDIDKVLRNGRDLYTLAWGHQRREKNHAMNLGNVSHDYSDNRRLEIRSVRPQKSMDVFVRQIELFEQRIRYLETIDHPIALKFEVNILRQDSWGEHKLDPPVDPQEALQAFYRYVTESGLQWQDHTDYLWPQWVADGEVEKFEQSEFFKVQEARASSHQNCSGILKVTRI